MTPTDLLPPVLTRLLARIRTPPPERPATFPTYDAALAACRTPAGYEEQELVSVVEAKTMCLRDELAKRPHLIANLHEAQLLLALGRVLSDVTSRPLRVLDLGGACGAHCLLARAALPDVAFRWHVVETPAMAAAGRQALEGDGLRFFDSLGAAREALGGVDFALSSGALQCTPDPLAFLLGLLVCDARWLYLTRLGLRAAGAGPLVAIHQSRLSANGPGPLPGGFIDRDIEYPSVFVARAAAESAIRQRYDVVMEFAESPAMYVVRGEAIPGLGYLARRGSGASTGGQNDKPRRVHGVIPPS